MKATHVTRANSSTAPLLENRSKKAQHKKIIKPNKKRVAFETPNNDNDEEQTSEDEDELAGLHEHGNKALQQSPGVENQRPNKDLPFKDVPEIAFVPSGRT